MKRNIIIAILIISTLLTAGCGSKECGDRADCAPRGSCYIASCVKNVCNYNLKPGCSCGDGVCNPADENPCNCAEDCQPACIGNAGKYMEQRCDEEQNCVTSVKEQKQQKPSDTIEISELNKKNMGLFARFVYDEPFNIDKSEFFASLKIDSKLDTIKDVLVKKIRLVRHTGKFNTFSKQWENDEVKIFAEKDANRVLWDESTMFNMTFPIKVEEEINDSLNMDLWAAIEIEYKMTDTLGREATKSYEYEKELSFIFVDPTEKAECPPRKEWDDGNPCTIEVCSENTDYFVERTMKKSCAGNFVCETGEDECNAESDCGPCTGDVGQYLQKVCYDGCKTKLREGITVNSDTITNTKNLQEIIFDAKVGLNKPFNVKSDVFTVEFQLIKKGTATGIKINKLQVIDQSSLIAEQTINKEFPLEGSSYKIVMGPLPQLETSIEGEDDKKPSLKVFYKYTSVLGTQTRDTIADYEISLGDTTFINPGVI